MPELNNKENKTNEIPHDLIPDNTITMILKSGGKVYSKGLTLPTLTPDMAEEDLLMALQRIKDTSDIAQNTAFYKLAGKPQHKEKPTLE